MGIYDRKNFNQINTNIIKPMKKLLTLLLVLCTTLAYSQGQNGGEITGKTQLGKSRSISIDSLSPTRFALRTSDSSAQVYLRGTKLLGDTILKNLKQDSTYLASINSGISTTNSTLSTINTTLGVNNTLTTTTNNNLTTINSSIGTTNTTLSSISGGINVISTDLSIPQANVSAGLRGNMILGAASTSPPSMTDGLVYPFSIDQTTGGLRVTQTSGSIKGTVKSTQPAYVNGAEQPLSLDTVGRLTIHDSEAIFNLQQINSSVQQINGNLNFGGFTWYKLNDIQNEIINVEDSLYEIRAGIGNIDSTNAKIDAHTSYTQGTTANSKVGNMIMGRVESGTISLGSGSLEPPRITTRGGLLTTIVDPTGNQIGGGGTGQSLNTFVTNTVATSLDSSTQRKGVVVLNTVPISTASLPLPTGAATETSLSQIASDLHNGQGVSSSSVKGGMMMGVVNSTPPTVSDATLSAPSLNTRGATRVAIMNGSNEVTTFADSTAGSRKGVVVLNTVPVTGTFTSSIPTYSVSGNITTQNLTPTRTETVGSAVTALCDGYSTATIKVRGTYTGALSIQVNSDDSTWVTIGFGSLTKMSSTWVFSLSTIASADTGVFMHSTYGAKKLRVTGLSAMTGTATVFIVLSTNTHVVTINPSQTIAVLSNANVINSVGDSYQFQNEDNPSGNAFSGTKMLVVRGDTLTSATTSANGDWSQITSTKHGSLIVKNEITHRNTYRASAVFNPVGSATDVFSIAGVASKTVMITKIIVSGTQTPTGGVVDLYLIKRSSADGSGTTMTAIPLDAGDAAANATVQYYTTNPSTGTAVGNLAINPLYISTTVTQPEDHVFDFGQLGKPITLNSASQAVCLNLNGVTVTGGKLYITVEWAETW